MSGSPPPLEIYSQQSNPAFEKALTARSAARAAAFMLPHLRAGMRVLDLGCGPGSITVGLADLVAPGEVIGIDAQHSLIEQARSRAAALGTTNVRFEAGDAYRLPCSDAAFDAAFANGTLMHLREPSRALAELRRVLRAQGFAAVRDPDLGAALLAPTTPRLERWFAVRIMVRRRNGGDPFLARRYRGLLLEAGFPRAEATASVESAGTPEEIHRHAAFLQAQLRGLARTAIAERWIDEAEVESTAAELDAWSRRPDAFAATIWCEAIGWMSN